MAFISLIFLFVVGCVAAPADDTVRVDLPVYDQPQESSNTRHAQSLEPESYGAEVRSDKSLVGNLIAHKVQVATNVLGNKLHVPQDHQAGFAVGYFSDPVTMREGALLETEGWGSKTLSIKENIHNIVAGIFQPKPIIDTIREEDKYGNTGDKFYGAGRAVVGGAEGISNFVNSVLEVPGAIFKKITRAATEKLNNLGGKLIGLN